MYKETLGQKKRGGGSFVRPGAIFAREMFPWGLTRVFRLEFFGKCRLSDHIFNDLIFSYRFADIRIFRRPFLDVIMDLHVT